MGGSIASPLGEYSLLPKQLQYRQNVAKCVMLATNTADYRRARFCIQLAILWVDMARRLEQ
jgi:hypothetical protein